MNYITFLRQFRIGPFAVFDTLLSYIGIFVLSPLLTKLFVQFKISIPLTSWLWWMLPISVLFHLFFSQQTPLMKALYQPQGFLVLSAVLITMIFMGIKNCSRIK